MGLVDLRLEEQTQSLCIFILYGHEFPLGIKRAPPARFCSVPLNRTLCLIDIEGQQFLHYTDNRVLNRVSNDGVLN